MDYISVAIDGPAGAGKSSVSKAVAKELGFVYIDTGAMYRAVALFALKNGINPETEAKKLVNALDGISLKIEYSDEGQQIILNGENVTGMIRTGEVSKGASDVAVIPQVRRKLVKMQQEMAKHDNVIMDGRDICSYVLPEAQVKIFLTASVEERAMRRCKEMIEKGMECDIEQIKKEIEYRDRNDSSRKESPLRQAPDAALVDTSDMTFEESVEKIKSMVKAVQ